MAVTAAIPLPESGADAFTGGMTTSQNMINSIMNNKYNQGQLGIAQQAEARAQSLLPKMLEKYADEHGRAASDNYVKDMYNTIVAHEYQQARPDLFGKKSGGAQPSRGYSDSNLTQQDKAAINGLQPGQSYTIPQLGANGNQPQQRTLPEANRQKLIQALRDPNISDADKQQISNFLVANPSAAQSQVIPAQNSQPNQVLSDENRKRLEAFIASGQASPEDVAQIKQFLASQAPISPGQPGMGGQIAAPSNMGQQEQQPGQQQGQQPGQQGQQPQGQQQLTNQNPNGQQPIENVPTQQGAPSQPPQVPMNTGQGSYSDTKNPMGVTPETTITPAKPGDEWKDKLAGVGEFANVKSKFDPKSGTIIREYPSGRMTMQKIPVPGVTKETAQEKSDISVDEFQQKEGIKESFKILHDGRALKSMVDKAVKIKQLLDENKDLTGLGSGLSSSLNLSTNKKLAEFDQSTKKLQADMARYGSQRGGAQAIKWAERTKPGIYRSTDYNQGMVKSIIEDAHADYDELAEEYRQATVSKKNPNGLEYPIKFPDIKFDEAKTEQKEAPKEPPKITKAQVTEDNIQHTMKEMNMTREQVVQRLKQKGLM